MALKEKERPTSKNDVKEQEGDVLGISHPNPGGEIPPIGGGHPKGIDVRDHATGIGDVKQTKGATGIDMGAGGTGTDVATESSHPKSADDADE
jgi:hypothetical protein